MRVPIACLLLSGLLGTAARAGEPVALAGHTLRGDVQVRLDTRSDGARATSVRDEMEILVRLGPSSDCFWPLRADQTVLSLGDGALALARGSWSVEARGGARLVLDPREVEDELRESYRLACGQTASTFECDQQLEALQAGVVRSDVRLKQTEGRLRVRARLDAKLIDPASGRVAHVWALAFRDAAGLHPEPPVDYDCGDDGGGVVIILPLSS